MDAEDPIQVWHIEGVVLSCKDGPRDTGTVSTADLLRFAKSAHDSWPNGEVWVHQFGLRVTHYENQEHGPHLDWRDWT